MDTETVTQPYWDPSTAETQIVSLTKLEAMMDAHSDLNLIRGIIAKACHAGLTGTDEFKAYLIAEKQLAEKFASIMKSTEIDS